MELLERALAHLGAPTLHFARDLRQLYGIFVRTLYFSVTGERNIPALVRSSYEIGNKSVPFLIVVMGSIGMILVYQAGVQTKRVVPDMTLIGATFIELMVRDLAASIAALMLATRVGAGIAAEIGSMVVTEQVDALRMCATDPVDYLIRPRFLPCILMTTTLVIITGAFSILTGTITGWVFFDINPRTFLDFGMVDGGDVLQGFAKCVSYGAAIPVVSGWCGLTTHGGSQGVGWATTRAVVSSSLTVIFLNLLISALGFMIFAS